MTLDEISILLVYSAMAVYALAFIAYAIDLARRSAVAAKAADDAKAASVEASGATADATGGGTIVAAPPKRAASVAYGRSPSLRVGVALTVVAWLLHLSADITLGLAAGRVPWANMY